MTLMDLEADYARHYGGSPRAEQSWHGVLAYIARIGRFDTRDILHTMTGHALSKAPSKDMAGQKAILVAKLERQAGY